jgi:hypothetical protein
MEKRRQKRSERRLQPPLDAALPESSPESIREARQALAAALEDELVECCFAIFPDEIAPGTRAKPIAIFDTLEDAMEWALQRFKGGAFRLRYERFILLDDDTAEPPSTRIM